MSSPWLPFLYQYIISGIVFLTGILISVKKGALDIKSTHDRSTLIQLVGGFILMMLLHAAMIITADI